MIDYQAWILYFLRLFTMASPEKFFVGGNWKCNGTKDSISKLVIELNSAKLEDDVDIVISPPFLFTLTKLKAL